MNGYGLPNGKLLGRVLESASEITFLLLLILLAKGYTVTRARLRQMSTIKVTVFICAYIIMYMALFLCEKLYFDPGKVLYLYESSFGYGLVILRMVGWLIFIYATFFTLKHYPEKVRIENICDNSSNRINLLDFNHMENIFKCCKWKEWEVHPVD